jgi:hypothetical protein
MQLKAYQQALPPREVAIQLDRAVAVALRERAPTESSLTGLAAGLCIAFQHAVHPEPYARSDLPIRLCESPWIQPPATSGGKVAAMYRAANRVQQATYILWSRLDDSTRCSASTQVLAVRLNAAAL